jgi:F-type H+-transporting ATPase subunit epsilon
LSETEQLNLEIVSPEKLVTAKSVDMIVISGTEGDFGVLPGHAPVVSSIRPGLLEIHENNNVEKFFVTGGFVEVLENKVSILANEISKIDEIDIVVVENEIKDLKEKLSQTEEEIAKSLIELEIYKLESKIESTKL